MIKTLRYAFVAALMMVAGAVNAQTTFNFKKLMDGLVPAAKDVLYLSSKQANNDVFTVDDVTMKFVENEPSATMRYYQYDANNNDKATGCIWIYGGKNMETPAGSDIVISKSGEKIKTITFTAPVVGSKGAGDFKASTGTLTMDKKTRDWTWTGEADEVTFTVYRKTAKANVCLCFSDITVNPTVETGINNITVDNAKKGVRYNLAGQRVNESYKGVVIENGKKMIVK